MIRTASLLVVFSLCLGSAARAAGESAAAVKGKLESLVRQAAAGPVVRGPSLTWLVTELLDSDPDTLGAVLKEAWEIRDSLEWESARCVEEVVQFLYGLPKSSDRPKGGGLWVMEGAVLVRVGKADDRWAGPFSGEDLPGFDQHLGKRAFRKAPQVNADGLSKALEKSVSGKWSESEKLSLAMALGEAARKDPAVSGKLLARYRKSPDDRLLAIAVGWAGGEEAVAALTDRFCELAPREESFSERLKELGRCLFRANRQAPCEVVWDLDGDAREKAMQAIGLELVLPVLLDDIESEDSLDGKLAAFQDFREVVSLSRGSGFLPAEEVPGLFKILASLADREMVLRTAEELLYAYNRYPIQSSFSSGGNSFSEKGQSLGPYPGIEPVLRAMAGDVAEGRLVFLDDPPGFFSPPPEPLGGSSHRAHSDVACPIPNMSEAEPDFPVHVGGEWVEEGFRLTLRNTGKKPFLVNPVALRYGTGQVTDVVVTRDGKREEFRALKLNLGFIRAKAAVPVGELVLLPPGQSYTWVQPMRGIDRDVDHIALSIGSIAVLGRTTHPLLTGLNDTWIR